MILLHSAVITCRTMSLNWLGCIGQYIKKFRLYRTVYIVCSGFANH